jgi:hypothetical protein
MSTGLIDTAVGTILFVAGLAYTIRKYGTHNRLAFTIAAALTPILAIMAVFQVAYAVLTRTAELGPCPAGLEDAERLIETHRQQMFGGPLREPSLAGSWKRLYALELQKDAEHVKQIANKYLAAA